ncbi:MAG: methyltransferase [Proteobacteria bacterium]|nr:methyltransferase [Pseudomonadota bacterium]
MSADEEPAPDPASIIRLATSYWESQCFLTANRLGGFEALGDGPKPADEVARALALSPRPTRLLLKACVGLELLLEDERGFRNHPSAQVFLVPGGVAYLGNAVRYGDDMWTPWTALAAALREGTPRVATETYTGDDPEKTRNFVYGMHNRAMGIGMALVGMLDLSGRQHLLDVGGGPGTYAALLTRANPGLRATVIDLPEVAALADEILTEMGAREQVEPLAGDYRETPWPTGIDAVLISGVFHRETEDTCREFIARAREALAPGGLLAVADVFTDAGGATPVFAALFGLNMMLSAPDGGVHADADVAQWLEDAGFRSVDRRPFPPPMPHRVVTGVVARVGTGADAGVR